MPLKTEILASERIESSILLIRGHKVILDSDLALMYGATVGRLNEAVKRNRDRFPADFMFQLSRDEFNSLSSKVVNPNLKSQVAISTSYWGGRRHPPYAFTEQGVAMLSSILRSKRAVQVNIEIMRAFVRLRQHAFNDWNGAERCNDWNVWNRLRYDEVVFDAIRQLMAPPKPNKRKIGFLVEEKAGFYGRR